VIASDKLCRSWNLGVALTLGISGAIAFSGNPATAQITPDKTLGAERSIVTPNLNIRGLPADQIDGGAIRGVNLFHSFTQFNVGNGQRVYFANPTGIENILSRVTGSNPSNIFGTLGVNGGASLFLLNPNGIIFGPNAKLDIAGSLVATTASSLVFNNGTEFSAKNPQAAPLLTINLRPGLQYASNPSGVLTNEGNLAVGKDLTLAANNLDLQGQLHAGGNLTLQALNTLQIRDSLTNPFIASAQGQLLAQGNQAVDIFALNHPASGFFSGGDTVLRSANTVGGDAHYTAGGSFRIEQLDGSLGNLYSPYDPIIRVQGDVELAGYRGGSLHILAGGSVTIPGDVTILRADTNAIAEAVPLSDGTTLLIDGRVLPTLDIRAGTTAFGAPAAPGAPTSGAITIGGTITNLRGVVFLTNQYNPNLQLAPGAISTGPIRAFGGSVAIDARDSITIPNGINTSINNGTGGNIRLLAGLGGIDTRGGILTAGSGSGNGGDIILTATGNIITDAIRSFVSLGATGNGGDIILTSRNGAIDTRGGELSSTTSRGNAGNVTLDAFSNIITGTIKSFVADTGQTGLGNGGNLTLRSTTGSIDTSRGTLFSSTDSGNGGTVNLTAFGNISTAGIQSLVGFRGVGFAGNINLISQGGAIDTTGITIDDQGKPVSGIESVVGDEGIGFGGNVNLLAFGDITTAGIETRVGKGGRGYAGDITLNSLTGAIDTTAGKLASDSPDNLSGTITLTAFGNITPGNISSTNSGSGKAGDLNLVSFTGDIFAAGRLIESSASGLARGGDIYVKARTVYLTDNTLLAANTYGTGTSGNVNIQAQSLFLTGGAEVQAQTFGAGNAGNILVNVVDSVTLSGIAPFPLLSDGRVGGFSSGLFSTTEEGATGEGGTIQVNANALRLENGAVLSARTRSIANGGDVTVNVNTLDITGGAQILTSAFSSGAAGGITINATGDVRISGADPDYLNRFNQIRQIFIDRGQTPQDALKNAQFVIDPVSSSSGLQTSDINGIGAAGDIKLTAGAVLLSDLALLETNTRGARDSGSVNIRTQVLSMTSGAEVLSQTFGAGRAGDITVEPLNPNAPSFVILSGVAPFPKLANGNPGGFSSGLFVTTEKGATGEGGDISINTSALRIENGAVLSARSRSAARGGDIRVNVNTLDIIGGGQILTTAFTSGSAGAITVNATGNVTISGIDPTFYDRFNQLRDSLRDDFIAAGQSQQDAQKNALELTRFVIDPVDATSSLQAQALDTTSQGSGNIIIKAGALSLLNGARVSANTFGQGNAGKIDVEVRDRVTLSGITPLTRNGETVRFVSGILSQVGSGAVGANGGDINIKARSLFMTDRSVLGVGTFGVGDAGNISVQVDDAVVLSQVSSIRSLVEQGGVGRGGKVDIRARSLTLKDGGQIGTVVFREENGTPGGRGQAGDITINASDFVTVSGVGEDPLNPDQIISSALLASTEQGGIGPGGNITVSTGNLLVEDGGFISAETRNTSRAGSIFLNVNNKLTVQNEGTISVNGRGQGDPGNLQIRAGSISMNQGGRLQATSASGRNANIILRVDDSIEMRFKSEISAQAFNNGNGGNISIKAGNNISAVLAEDSDIVANAEAGTGGSVIATARGVFGFREAGKTRTIESDFTASSVFGINGTERIESEDRLAEALPVNLVDPTGLIDRRCSVAKGSNVSSFTVRGRGGLPSNPGDPLRSDAMVSNWVTLDSDTEKKTSPTAVAPISTAPTQPNQIVEAQGWVIDSNGKVVLTAQAPTVTPQGYWYPSPECRTPHASTLQPKIYR
jgi:filamentous hemagglutinin family protein